MIYWYRLTVNKEPNRELRTVNGKRRARLGAGRKRSRHDYYLPVSATVVPAPITVVAAMIAVVISAIMIPATVVVSTVVTGVSLSGSRQTTEAADGHS